MFPETGLRERAMSCADATKQAFDRLAVSGGFGFVADDDPTACATCPRPNRLGS